MPDPQYKISVHDDDDLVEVVLRSPSGDKWEYGIPFNRATGRFDFEDIKVVELDFGEQFAERMLGDIRNAVRAAISRS